MKALSIRQPWAWLIVRRYKPIENRTWATGFRGELFIHASKGMTVSEYEAAKEFARRINPAIEVPNYGQLERGGIIGRVYMSGCVTEHASPWFTGPYGFIMPAAEPVPFRAVKGQLGFFDV